MNTSITALQEREYTLILALVHMEMCIYTLFRKSLISCGSLMLIRGRRAGSFGVKDHFPLETVQKLPFTAGLELITPIK